MQHLHHLINLWPVLVAAVMIWVLGALWFSSVLFAKPWAAIVGRQMGEKPKGVAWGMICSFIGDVLLAFILDHVILWSHASTWMDGIHIGAITWVGFVAAIMYPQTIYEGRPLRYFTITGGYWLIAFVAAGALLAVWR
ncbi:MAG TPA: DUF1761 domain-containing protein [Terracidiphilus sp.]|nr:DUF1761 domain-containing protein [Terracidiphilus sp.]